MITVSIKGKKLVLVVCYDKACGKYRSINTGERTVSAQMFNSPRDVEESLKGLKQKGAIDDYEIIDNETK